MPIPTTRGLPFLTAKSMSGQLSHMIAQSVGPPQLRGGSPYGISDRKTGLQMFGYQLRNDLGIGFRKEPVAFPLKICLQFPVILNDAVVNYGNTVHKVRVRIHERTARHEWPTAYDRGRSSPG